MSNYQTETFPPSRIATFDVCAVGKRKHHIPVMLEVDVTASREKIKQARSKTKQISFTAWLVKVISLSIQNHPQAAAFLQGKRKLRIFKDIHVSMVVEKLVNEQLVPIPLLIEKANERTLDSITKQIQEAKESVITDKELVLQAKSSPLEQVYYYLPGFVRRFVWRCLLRMPKLTFGKMGNVAITSIGMAGNVHAWFIPISVHPICFGISTIAKKPLVIHDKIEIREVLHMTILIDHDVMDGVPMARFIRELSENLEKGLGL